MGEGRHIFRRRGSMRCFQGLRDQSMQPTAILFHQTSVERLLDQRVGEGVDGLRMTAFLIEEALLYQGGERSFAHRLPTLERRQQRNREALPHHRHLLEEIPETRLQAVGAGQHDDLHVRRDPAQFGMGGKLPSPLVAHQGAAFQQVAHGLL